MENIKYSLFLDYKNSPQELEAYNVVITSSNFKGQMSLKDFLYGMLDTNMNSANYLNKDLNYYRHSPRKVTLVGRTQSLVIDDLFGARTYIRGLLEKYNNFSKDYLDLLDYIYNPNQYNLYSNITDMREQYESFYDDYIKYITKDNFAEFATWVMMLPQQAPPRKEVKSHNFGFFRDDDDVIHPLNDYKTFYFYENKLLYYMYLQVPKYARYILLLKSISAVDLERLVNKNDLDSLASLDRIERLKRLRLNLVLGKFKLVETELKELYMSYTSNTIGYGLLYSMITLPYKESTDLRKVLYSNDINEESLKDIVIADPINV